MSNRSSAPPFYRPPPRRNSAGAGSSTDPISMIRAGDVMLRRESNPRPDGTRVRFNTPTNHRSSSKTSSTPPEKPPPKRTPKDGILVTFPLVRDVTFPTTAGLQFWSLDGPVIPTNRSLGTHRMQPVNFDNRRGTGYHSAPPCAGRNDTVYGENYRHPDSLNSSPMSIVPMNEYAKGGRVKKTGTAKLHKDEVVLPVSLVKQLTKLMKKK